MSDVHHFERTRSLLVSSGSGHRTQRSVVTCECEGGRIHRNDGGIEMFSGVAPGPWDLSFPVSSGLADVDDTLATVAAYASGGGRWNLQYLEKESVRLIVGRTVDPRPTVRRVWALTGHIVSERGRVVAVGESGLGSGLPRLRDEARREALSRRVAAINQAEPTCTRNGPVVLAPPAAGLLLHEAIGHFAEADEQIDLRPRLGVRVAAEPMDVWDDPAAPGGVAGYHWDDDGVASFGPTAVVRGGILTGLLHSFASAAGSGVAATANGRAASGWDKPIARMSNLICRHGDASEDQLLDMMREGLYIHSLADGVSCGGRVEARIRVAEQVRHGRRTGCFVTGGSVQENRFLFTRASAVGGDGAYYQNGICGKAGQVLYDVGTCAPSILISELCVRA